MHTQVSEPMLVEALLELDREVARGGWGQALRLFALVPNDQLIIHEPELAARLELTPGGLTSVEQDDVDAALPVEELLAGIAWPEQVSGAAVVVERWVLPPSAEEGLSGVHDDEALRTIVSEHPQRQDVRILAGATREGLQRVLMRIGPPHDALATEAPGEQLAPGLSAALAGTFAPDGPDSRSPTGGDDQQSQVD